MKKLLLILSALGILLFCESCFTSKKTVSSTPQSANINLALIDEPQPNRYVNLDYGIKLYVKDKRANSNVLKKYDASIIGMPTVNVSPSVTSFVNESVRRYMRTMGFNLDADVSTDYLMTLSITDYNLSYLSGVGWSAVVMMSVQVQDKNSRLVYPSVNIAGRYSQSGSSSDFTLGNRVLNQAYFNALEDIDWDRIAYFLKKADTPALEKNKQVEGDGSTSLESTVIRWYVDSSPRGADVYWRVISSTPDVKNTNQNYLGTTPYESTETFDIKGLTYNNAGNVQIEISCERAGYIVQSRKVNLRQAIDQKEISMKLNLIEQ